MIILNLISKRILLGFVGLLALVGGLSNLDSLYANNAQSYGENLIPGEILIGLRSEAIPFLVDSYLHIGMTGISSLDILNRKYGVQKLERLFPDIEPGDYDAIEEGLDGIFKVVMPKETDLIAMISDYEADPHIEYAEGNLIIEIFAKNVPNDPKFKKQWALDNKKDTDIDAPEAWKIEKGKKDLLIAVIDTGVNYMHEDLDDGRVRIDIGKDFVNEDEDPMDDNGHGTYCAGIISANTDNKIGVAGVCWNCSILPIKTLDEDGEGSADQGAKGIKYAADKKAKILNMSWAVKAGKGCSKTIAKTINYAWKKGCLLIAAAGNDSHKELLGYPASSPRVVAVGATNKNDKRAKFSNQGEGLDVVAPGDKILGLWLGNSSYKKKKGTSAAAPHVSGVAGLILSYRPKLKAGQVWWILQHSADDLGDPDWDKEYGWGRINALNALKQEPKGKIKPPKDKCKTEPECAANVAVESDKESESIMMVLRTVRDKIFAESNVGKRWIQLYYRHNVEAASMILFDEELRLGTRDFLKKFVPIFRVLIEGDSGDKPVILTLEKVDAFYNLMEKLANRGSDQMREDIISELDQLGLARFVGQEALRLWEQINTEARR